MSGRITQKVKTKKSENYNQGTLKTGFECCPAPYKLLTLKSLSPFASKVCCSSQLYCAFISENHIHFLIKASCIAESEESEECSMNLIKARLAPSLSMEYHGYPFESIPTLKKNIGVNRTWIQELFNFFNWSEMKMWLLVTYPSKI